jgi:hypothetical protein
MVNEPLKPATLKRKFFRICLPFTDKSTSGWYCTPYSMREGFSIPAQIVPLVAVVYE